MGKNIKKLTRDEYSRSASGKFICRRYRPLPAKCLLKKLHAVIEFLAVFCEKKPGNGLYGGKFRSLSI